MSKRELLITTLQQLQPSRNLAEGFLALVTREECAESTMDQIISFLATGIRTIQNKQLQTQLQKNRHQLEELKAQEKVLHDQETADAEDLLSALT